MALGIDGMVVALVKRGKIGSGAWGACGGLWMAWGVGVMA